MAAIPPTEPSSESAPLKADPPPSPKKPFHKRRGPMAVLILVIIAGAIGGVLYWMQARQYEETDDAFIDSDISPIGAKISGSVLAVRVKDNQDVVAGQVLVEIDPRDIQARLSQAAANLDAARAKLEVATTNVELTRANTQAALTQAKAGVALAEAGVKAAESQASSTEADVTAAEAEETRRQADLARFEAVDPRAVPKQQVDVARAAAQSAAAQLAAARKRLSAAESQVAEATARVGAAEGALHAAGTGEQQVAVARAQVRHAQAGVEEAQAAVDAEKLQLSYTTIRSPVSGRVTKKSVQPGQYLQEGSLIMAVVGPGVWVVGNFKETQLAEMCRGQVVDVWVDAYPDLKLRGRVDSVQAGTGGRFSLLPPENATGNYVKVVQRVPVKITLDADETSRWLLGAGMSVVPRVHVRGGPKGSPLPIAPTTQPERD